MSSIITKVSDTIMNSLNNTVNNVSQNIKNRTNSTNNNVEEITIDSADTESVNVDTLDLSNNQSNNNIDNNTEIKQIETELKAVGLNNHEIERIINNESTIEEILKEIENNPERKKELLTYQYIQKLKQEPSLNLNNDINSLEDIQNIINSLNIELKTLNEEKIKDNNHELDALINIITRLKSGENLESILSSEIVAWKYTDENGNINYRYDNPYAAGNNDIVYEPLTYEKMYGNTENLNKLKNILDEQDTFFAGKVHRWSETQDQENYLNEISNKYNSIISNRENTQKEYNDKISALIQELQKYKYVDNYIKTEVDYRMKNIEPYITKDDFIKNNNFNEKSKDNLKELINKYKVQTIGTSDMVVPTINISDKNDIIDIINCIINNKGNIEDGKIVTTIGTFEVNSPNNMVEHFKKWSKLMTAEEVSIFNYIYNTEGTDKAYEYLENISKSLDNRWLANKTQEDKEYASEHPYLASIGSIVRTPIEGMTAVAYTINSKINNESIKRTDVYSSGNVWRGQVSEDIAREYGDGWAFVYNTGMSMGDTALLIGANAMTGGMATPVLSAALMGSRAYVSTLNDALDRGISDNRAILLAGASAIVETAMESYSLGHLMNLEGKLGESTALNAKKIASKIGDKKIADIVTKSFYIGANALSQGIAEGEEEFATEILNYVADILVASDLSNYTQSIKNYLDMGYTEDQAMNATMRDFSNQAVQAFVGGFASGICFGALGGTKSTINTSYGIANNMYNNLEGNTNAERFASALEINQQQLQQLQDINKKSKKNQPLTLEEALLVKNGTIEMQAAKALKNKILNRSNSNITNNATIKTKEPRNYNSEHGFQVTEADFGPLYSHYAQTGFFSEEQIKNMLESINGKGYISEEVGSYLETLFDGESDIYIKTIHSNDVDSIFEEGVRCQGNVTSGFGEVPTTIEKVDLENTVTKLDGLFELVIRLKNAKGISQGGNLINGTLIIKVPKGTNLKDSLVWNNQSNTFNINPNTISSFMSLNNEGEVGLQQKTSEDVNAKIQRYDELLSIIKSDGFKKYLSDSLFDKTVTDYDNYKKYDVIQSEFYQLQSELSNTSGISNKVDISFSIDNYLNEIFIDEYLKDPTIIIPEGISNELVEYLEKYSQNPNIATPTSIPPEIIEYIKNKSFSTITSVTTEITGKVDNNENQNIEQWIEEHKLNLEEYFNKSNKKRTDIAVQAITPDNSVGVQDNGIHSGLLERIFASLYGETTYEEDFIRLEENGNWRSFSKDHNTILFRMFETLDGQSYVIPYIPGNLTSYQQEQLINFYEQIAEINKTRTEDNQILLAGMTKDIPITEEYINRLKKGYKKKSELVEKVVTSQAITLETFVENLKQKYELSDADIDTIVNDTYKEYSSTEELSSISIFSNDKYLPIIQALSEDYTLDEIKNVFDVSQEEIDEFISILQRNNLTVANVKAFNRYTSGSNLILAAKRGVSRKKISQKIDNELVSRLTDYGFSQDFISKVCNYVNSLDYSKPLHKNWSATTKYLEQYGISKKYIAVINSTVMHKNSLANLDETLSSLEQGLTTKLPESIRLKRAIRSDFLKNRLQPGEDLTSLKGKIIEENGYSSTSPFYDTSFAKYDAYDVVYDIYAPKGTQGILITPFSNYGTAEEEVLLNANDLYVTDVIQGFVDKNGRTKTIIKCIILSKDKSCYKGIGDKKHSLTNIEHGSKEELIDTVSEQTKGPISNNNTFKSLQEITMDQINNISSETIKIGEEEYFKEDIIEYLKTQEYIREEINRVKNEEQKLAKFIENLKQKYGASQSTIDSVKFMLDYGFDYSGKRLAKELKIKKPSEVMEIYEEYQKEGLGEIKSQKRKLNELIEQENKGPIPKQIKEVINEFEELNNITMNLSKLSKMNQELKQKLLTNKDFKEYFLHHLLSTNNAWQTFKNSYNSLNDTLSIEEIVELLKDNDEINNLTSEEKYKLNILYSSLFDKSADTTWNCVIENDNLFKSIMENVSNYTSVIGIKDYELLQKVINKIQNEGISFNYYSSLARESEQQSRLVEENFSNETIKRIILGANKDVQKDFFMNNSKSKKIASILSGNEIVTLAKNGIKFNDDILLDSSFFEKIKEMNLIKFRNNINILLDSNPSLALEEKVQEYYDKLLESYDSEHGVFKQYLEEETEENYMIKNYILDYEARELKRPKYDLMTDKEIIDIEGLKKLTSKKISEIVIDGLFKDNIYNVQINIEEILRYNDSLSESEKILSQEEVDFYTTMLNIDSVSSQDKINIYNMLKDKNISLKFYEDVRKAKDAAYDAIKKDMVKLPEHNELIDSELSKQTGTTVYDFRKQKFTALVRALANDYDETKSQEMECYSLISDENTATIGDEKEKVIYGYSDFNNDYVVHMAETDVYSKDSRDGNNATNYPNRIATTSQLTTSDFGINEINIATKEVDGKHQSIMTPAFIVSKNEITEREIAESKRLGIPIMLINENLLTNENSTKELGNSIDIRYHGGYIENQYDNLQEREQKRKDKVNIDKSIINDSLIEALNETFNQNMESIPTDLEEFENMVKKIREITDENVPTGYKTAQEYKQSFIRNLINSGKINELNNQHIYVLTLDPIMFNELIGTENLNNLYIKNLANLPDRLVPNFENLTQEQFNKLFDSKSMKEYINEMDALTLATVLKKFNFSSKVSWLGNETIVNKINNMRVQDFYEFVKNLVFYSSELKTFINSDNYNETCNSLLETINNKFYTKEFILNHLEYKDLISIIIPGNLSTYTDKNADSKAAKNIESINNTTKEIDDTINNAIISSSNIPITVKYKLLSIDNSNDASYYDLFYELDGVEQKITIKKSWDNNISLYQLTNDSNIVKAALEGNFIITKLEVNQPKSNLVLNERNGIKQGLNEIELIVDGVEQKRIGNFKNNTEINLNYEFPNAQNVIIKSVKPIGSLDVEVEDGEALYLIKYEIEGKEYEHFIAPEKPIFSDKKNNILNINSFVEENNLIGIKNIKVSKIDLKQIIQKYQNVSKYIASSSIFNNSKYGGNQSDVASLIQDKISGKPLSIINTKKAEILDNLITKYFPNATDIQKVNIATHYANGGCYYMAVANAFATYMGSVENGETVFKEKFGFELTSSDGTNTSYNMEAIAFDIYLRYVSKNFNNDIDEMVKNNSVGVSIMTFKSKIYDYFVEHGIKIKSNTPTIEGRNHNLNSKLFEMLLNENSSFNILSASNFDIEMISNEQETAESLDKALENSEAEGKIIRDVGGHAMLITDIDENGNIIVSSWSGKYKFLSNSINEHKEKGKPSRATINSISFEI